MPLCKRLGGIIEQYFCPGDGNLNVTTFTSTNGEGDCRRGVGGGGGEYSIPY